jgi:hypothetical protein
MNLKTMSPGQANLQHRRQYYHQCGTTVIDPAQRTGQTTNPNQDDEREGDDYVFECFTNGTTDLRE